MRTQKFVSQTSGASLLIVERDNVRRVDLDMRAEWAIGRYDPNIPAIPDIPLASYLVSRSHGWLKNPGGQWYYVDNHENTNGTYLNGRKLPRDAYGQDVNVALNSGDILRIDNYDLNEPSADGVLLLFTTVPITGQFSTFSLQGKDRYVIGRDKDCDLCENLPYFSAKHAEIRLENGRFKLYDCKSLAGVFVNGTRIEGAVTLQEKDIISICDRNYFFLSDKLLYLAADPERSGSGVRSHSQHAVVLKADIDYKRVRDDSGAGMKELIRDIHLEVREGTLVALLGTAGAGKSTIMNCLNGMDLQGVQGSVVYRGTDLMKHFEQMKYVIGSVPQRKTFHPDFSPEQEFRIAAKKRLPADTTAKEIEERVDTTLKLLGIEGVRKSKNSKLSGGEQTRVNIGIELVADRDRFAWMSRIRALTPNISMRFFRSCRIWPMITGKPSSALYTTSPRSICSIRSSCW